MEQQRSQQQSSQSSMSYSSSSSNDHQQQHNGGGAGARSREHPIARHEHRVVGAAPSAQDKFKEEMQRMEAEMRRFHEQFRHQGGHRGERGAVLKPEMMAIDRPPPGPPFSSSSSSSMAPDRHRTTMDVQLHQPAAGGGTARSEPGGSNLLSVVPAAPPQGPHADWLDATWRNYFENNPDSPLIEHTQQDGKQLRLRFDVSAYRPEEVSVKTTGNRLRVAAKHDDDSGSGSKNFREFSKEFQLPDNIDPELLRSSLSKDGILTVEAPLPELGNNVPPRDY